tara:strand:+ start:350 stop:466 length:117 start_codon:yes stop_codon:yes gene_type:complete
MTQKEKLLWIPCKGRWGESERVRKGHQMRNDEKVGGRE